MKEKLMFKEVKELCLATGTAIDRIANDCNINQDLVAKIFIKVMEQIINDMDRQRGLK